MAIEATDTIAVSCRRDLVVLFEVREGRWRHGERSNGVKREQVGFEINRKKEERKSNRLSRHKRSRMYEKRE